jgi:hypothetical protein
MGYMLAALAETDDVKAAIAQRQRRRASVRSSSASTSPE